MFAENIVLVRVKRLPVIRRKLTNWITIWCPESSKLTSGRIEVKKLCTLLILSAAFAFGQISIGIQIGPPPPRRVVRVLPPSPSPDFVWIEGYWYATGNHYKWHAGYWTRPAYPAARWIAPHYERGRYFNGYWDGGAGRREHDHHWDRDRDRDYREQHHGRGRGRGPER